MFLSFAMFLTLNSLNNVVYANNLENSSFVSVKFINTNGLIVEDYMIEKGKSLNDYDNNLLLNGDFSSKNNAFLNRGNATFDYLLPNGINIKSNGTNICGIFQSFEVYDFYLNTTFTLSCEITNANVSDSTLVYFGLSNANDQQSIGSLLGSTSYFNPTVGKYEISISVPSTLSEKYFNIFLVFKQGSTVAGDEISLNYLKLEIGSNATPYINKNYLLKRVQNGLSNFNDFSLNFNSEINSDLFIFPVILSNEDDSYSLGFNTGFSEGYQEGYKAFSNLGFYPSNSYNILIYGGKYIWFDGIKYHYDQCNRIPAQHYIFDKDTNKWLENSYSIDVSGDCIWSDGKSIYYSYGEKHYLYNKLTDTFSPITFTGLSSFYGSKIWSDGTNVYYSYTHVFDKNNLSFIEKKLTGFRGEFSIPCEFNNSYYMLTNYNVTGNSYSYKMYKLTPPSTSFVEIDYSGFTNGEESYFNSIVSSLWSDGTNLYYSMKNNVSHFNFIFNTETFEFKPVTWVLFDEIYPGNFVEMYGELHYIYLENHYTFNTFNYSDADNFYQLGYNQGVKVANNTVTKNNASYKRGYENGYNSGLENAGKYSFVSLIGAVVDTPVRAFTSLLNFDVLGINMLDFICGLLTLSIVAFITKSVIGGK